MGQVHGMPPEGAQIYTLAQTGTTSTTFGRSKPGINLVGKGTALSNLKAIKGRAKRKQISQVLAIRMVEIAQKEGNRKLEKTFWNTFHCFNKINALEGRIYGKYCKNRMCLVCLSIRKAEKLNKYLPVLKQWSCPYFLTLTVKAIPAKKLKAVIENMLYGFKKIIDKYKKIHQRGKGKKLIGIRTLECNFNPQAKTYNPHFHLIVPDEETGNNLMQDWLKISKKGWTARPAQNMQKVHNAEQCLIEVVKYGSKIFTEPDVNKKSNQKTNRTIYLKALYTIVEAMQGKRLFDRFGFNLPINKLFMESEVIFSNQYQEFEFDIQKSDWLDSSTATPLSEFKPDPKINFLLENCINDEVS